MGNASKEKWWEKVVYYVIQAPFEIVTDFLMDHPLATLLVQIVLCAAAAYATTFVLVLLRSAGYIP